MLYCSGKMCVGVTVWFGWGGVVSRCRLKQYFSLISYHNRVHSLFLFDGSWNPVYGKNYGCDKSYAKINTPYVPDSEILTLQLVECLLSIKGFVNPLPLKLSVQRNARKTLDLNSHLLILCLSDRASSW